MAARGNAPSVLNVQSATIPSTAPESGLIARGPRARRPLPVAPHFDVRVQPGCLTDGRFALRIGRCPGAPGKCTVHATHRLSPRKGSVMIPKILCHRHRHRHRQRRFPGRLGILLTIGFCALPLVPLRSPAAAVSSNIKLDATDLSHPLTLDQNGNRLAMPTQSHPVVLGSGVTPSYVAYPLDGDDVSTQEFPSVSTGPAKAGQTTGPLHFNAVMQQKLDAELAQYGQASVHTPTNTYLVKPLAPMFTPLAGTADTTGSTTIWLANQAKPSLTSRTPGATTPATSPATPPSTTTTTTTATTQATGPGAGSQYHRRDQPGAAQGPGEPVHVQERASWST